jgi:hypothetical protein
MGDLPFRRSALRFRLSRPEDWSQFGLSGTAGQ